MLILHALKYASISVDDSALRTAYASHREASPAACDSVSRAQDGYTPLNAAAVKGLEGCVRLLVEAKADVDTVNKERVLFFIL